MPNEQSSTRSPSSGPVIAVLRGSVGGVGVPAQAPYQIPSQAGPTSGEPGWRWRCATKIACACEQQLDVHAVLVRLRQPLLALAAAGELDDIRYEALKLGVSAWFSP